MKGRLTLSKKSRPKGAALIWKVVICFRRRSRHQFGRDRDRQSWCSRLLPKFLLMTAAPLLLITVRRVSVASRSRSRCCQRAKRCIAAESISCTTPRPHRWTSEPVTCALAKSASPFAKVPIGRLVAHRAPPGVGGNVPGQRPVNISLYCPHSPKSTVAPTGDQALLIPAFTYQTSVSLAALS